MPPRYPVNAPILAILLPPPSALLLSSAVGSRGALLEGFMNDELFLSGVKRGFVKAAVTQESFFDPQVGGRVPGVHVAGRVTCVAPGEWFTRMRARGSGLCRPCAWPLSR